MDKFLKEYNGHKFDDWGYECSRDFKAFARKFRRYLKRNLPVGYDIIGHICGYYHICGFVRKEDSYIYYSYTWDRINKLDVYDGDFNDGSAVVARTTKYDKDYTGCLSHFTSIYRLPELIVALSN